MPSKIAEGDYVLLFLKPRKTYLVEVGVGKTFHTHKGFLKLDELIGKDYGTNIVSSLGHEFVAFKPALRDHVVKSSRQTQISYPKDIALIIMFGEVGPGSQVVEAGTGTGALTMALASYVRPNGKIYSYELRQEFARVAEKNLRRSGVRDFVELKNKDITDGIDERNVDSVVLDLAVPWLVIPHACAALKPSGAIVSFSPTIDQVVKTVEALKENGFADVETIESLVRGMQIERGKTRPQTLMTAHTGYLTYARKTVNTGHPVMRSEETRADSTSAR